jgi:tetraacyldisaccharide 4'-kinase
VVTLRIILIGFQVIITHLNPLTYVTEIFCRFINSQKKRRILTEHFVISVGNLTVGGVGKTPFTLWLAFKLKGAGKQISILNKSYKAQAKAAGEVKELTYEALKQFGDEALLYKSYLPESDSVFSGPIKGETLKFLNQKKLSNRVVIVDDGYQHTQIKRDLNILLIDLSDPFMWSTLPFGRAREWIWSIRHADLIVITKGRFLSPQLKSVLKKWVQFFAKPFVPVVECDFQPIWPLVEDDSKVMVLSGLAKNQAFKKAALEHFGDKVVQTFSFEDHADFNPEQMKPILEYFKQNPDACLLVTEKDAVKIKILYPELKLAVVKLKTEVDKDEIILDLIRRQMH